MISIHSDDSGLLMTLNLKSDKDRVSFGANLFAINLMQNHDDMARLSLMMFVSKAMEGDGNENSTRVLIDARDSLFSSEAGVNSLNLIKSAQSEIDEAYELGKSKALIRVNNNGSIDFTFN